MRIAAMRPQPGTSTTGAALRRSEEQAATSALRPRVNEDVYSGSQDSESLWMASAWRGGSGGGSGDQPAPSTVGQTAEAAAQATAPAELPAQPASGSRISFWA